MSFHLRSGHPALWKAAQKLGTFTVKELAEATPNGSVALAHPHVRAWLAVGVIDSDGASAPGRPGRFTVNGKELPIEASREHDNPTTNMWRAIRGLRTFTAVDIAAHATLPGAVVEVSEAASYCRALLSAGIIRVASKGGRQRHTNYRLIRDLGPAAPERCRVSAIWDPNEGRFVYVAPRST